MCFLDEQSVVEGFALPLVLSVFVQPEDGFFAFRLTEYYAGFCRFLFTFFDSTEGDLNAFARNSRRLGGG